MSKKISDNYLKVVEWSQPDRCYVGSAPGLMLGGVHGKDQAKVFKSLCQVVEEVIGLMKKEGKALPPATANKEYSGKILLRISPDLHKAISIKALQEGQSLNKLIQHKLETAV